MGLFIFLIFNMIFSALFFKTIASGKKFNFLYVTYNMALFSFLSMFRSITVGNDTIAYVEIFNNIMQSGDISPYQGRFEIGYLYLNKWLSSIFHHHQVLLIITSIYIFFGVGRFIYKYSNMAWLSVILFFSLRYFDLSLSGIRHMLAVTTVLFAYDFIIKKHPIKFVITVIIATTFHNAAFIFLLAYPISKFKLTKRLITISSLSCIFLLLFLEESINVILTFFPHYYPYVYSAKAEGEVKLATLLGLLVMVIILFAGEIFNNKIVKSKVTNIKEKSLSYIKTNHDEIQSVFILIACVIMLVALRVDIFSRFSQIYSVFAIVYLPNAIGKIKDRHLKTTILIFVVVLFFAYIIAIQVLRPEWQSTYPYFFFWNDK